MVLRMSDLSAGSAAPPAPGLGGGFRRRPLLPGRARGRHARYDPQRPAFYPPRLRRPPEAAPTTPREARPGTPWGSCCATAPPTAPGRPRPSRGCCATSSWRRASPIHARRLFDASEEPDDPETADWRGWDSNWRQFIGITLAIILDEYRDHLPGDLAARLDRAVVLAVEGEILEARLRPPTQHRPDAQPAGRVGRGAPGRLPTGCARARSGQATASFAGTTPTTSTTRPPA